MPQIIFKSGNSTIVSLPPEALEYLELSVGANVSVELDLGNRRIIIAPIDNPLAHIDVKDEFNQQLKGFIDLHRPPLEKLSE